MSTRPMYSLAPTLEHVSTQRVVIPKEGVERPRIAGAKVRTPVYEDPVMEEMTAALRTHLEGMTTEEQTAFMDRVWDAFLAENPNSVIRPGVEDPYTVLYGLGGREYDLYGEYSLYGVGYPAYLDEDIQDYVPLRANTGERVKVIAVNHADNGDLQIRYQIIPDDLTSSVAHGGIPSLIPGMTTNLERGTVYETTIPADQIATTTALSGQKISVDPEAEYRSFYGELVRVLHPSGWR